MGRGGAKPKYRTNFTILEEGRDPRKVILDLSLEGTRAQNAAAEEHNVLDGQRGPDKIQAKLINTIRLHPDLR